ARRVHADGAPWRGTVVYSPFSGSLTFKYEPAYRWHGRKVAASFRVESKRSEPFWYIATWSDDDFSAYLTVIGQPYPECPVLERHCPSGTLVSDCR
ncbi:MAG: hypothetical protein ACE5LB_03845, partial [Acidiferrobacterales bacterium]